MTRLNPDAALARELANETFAAKEERFHFARCPQPWQNGDSILQRFLKRHDVTGIDDESFRHIDLEDRAVGVEEDVAGSRCLEQHKTFAAEESLGTLPLSGDFHSLAVEHVRSALQIKRIAVESMVGDVTGGTAGKHDLACTVLRGESIDDQAFTPEHPAESLSESALEAGLQVHRRRHRHHRRRFRKHFFPRR